MRVFWYRKSLFEKADVALPTDWPSLLEAGKALKKVGAFGFTTDAGSGNNYANHSMIMMMVNNGGGVFTKDGELDLMNDPTSKPWNSSWNWCTTDRRSAPSATPPTTVLPVEGRQSRLRPDPGQRPAARWRHLRDLLVADPIKGPHGDKAAIVFPNNIMMYTNTPSQESSEAFLVYYLDNLKDLWKRTSCPPCRYSSPSPNSPIPE